jgi:hypothetical protein
MEQELIDMLKQLTRIADALERLSQGGEPVELALVQPIEKYSGFDWSSIGATIIHEDPEGPTHVEWKGQIYTRRSPTNKFDPAIWYSRAAVINRGKNEEADVKYLRLITFKTIKEADPLDRKAARAVQAGQDKKDGK